MKTEYRIYVALAIAAIMFGAYYMVRKDDKAAIADRTKGSAGATDLPALALPEADIPNITKLHIKNADKSDVTLERKGETWEVTAPVQAAANQKNVTQLLDNLKALKATEVIDRTAGSYEQYELSDAKAVHLVAYKGDTPALDLYFGKSGKRGQMTRIAGTDGVYIADGYSSFLYTREVKNWRETELLKFEDKNVIQATVENKNGKFSFSKNGEEWSGSYQERGDDGSLKKAGSWDEFEPKKVGDMLRAYKNLRAQDFAEEGADTGLDQPNEDGGTVHIVLQDDAGKFTIKVGKVQAGSNRFALKEGGDGTVVVLSSWSADWATAEKSKFEKDAPKEGEAGMGDDKATGDKDDKGDKPKLTPAPKKDAPKPEAPAPKPAAPAAP